MEYRRRRKQGWRRRGTRAQLRRAMETKGGTKFAVGEVVIVASYYRGWYLSSLDNRRHIARVPERDLEWLDPPVTAEEYDRRRGCN